MKVRVTSPFLLCLALIASCTETEEREWRTLADSDEEEGNPAGSISDGVEEGAPDTVQMMAIRPAYATLHGPSQPLQLTLHVWCREGYHFEDIHAEFLHPDIEEPATVTWSTENFGIATVDESGLVESVSSGDTMITATLGEKTAVARIIVEPVDSLDPNIDITPDPP